MRTRIIVLLLVDLTVTNFAGRGKA